MTELCGIHTVVAVVPLIRARFLGHVLKEILHKVLHTEHFILKALALTLETRN